MRGGYFRVYRKLFDPSNQLHPSTTGEPACRGFAWLDLCSMARYEDSDGLKRGQLYMSTRTMAGRWNWSHQKVKRVMDEWRDATRVETVTQPGRKATIVTVCNYDSYNPLTDESVTQALHKRDTTRSPRVTRRSNKQEKQEVAEPKTTWLTPYWDAWVDAYGEGSEPPAGILAKNLRPLDKKHGSDVVLSRWVYYLSKTGASFVSVPKFVQTFGTWKPESEPMSEYGSETFFEAQR